MFIYFLLFSGDFFQLIYEDVQVLERPREMNFDLFGLLYSSAMFRSLLAPKNALQACGSDSQPVSPGRGKRQIFSRKDSFRFLYLGAGIC